MCIYFYIDYHLSAPYTMEEAVTVIQCDNCDSFLQKLCDILTKNSLGL